MWGSIGLKRTTFYVKAARVPVKEKERKDDEKEIDPYEKKGLRVLFEEIRNSENSAANLFWNRRQNYSSDILPQEESVGERSISSILALAPLTLAVNEIQDAQEELSNHLEHNSKDALLIEGVIKLVSDPKVQDVIASNPEFQKLVEIAYSKEKNKHLIMEKERDLLSLEGNNLPSSSFSTSEPVPIIAHSHHDEIRQTVIFCENCAKSIQSEINSESNIQNGNAGINPRLQTRSNNIPNKLVFLVCVVFVGLVVMKYKKLAGIELIKTCVRSFIEKI